MILLNKKIICIIDFEREVIKMEVLIQELIQELKQNTEMLKTISNTNKMPKLLYVKDIVENYKVNANKAGELCKRYGTNFGGYCIEAEVLKEVLQTKGQDIFK